jgi:hypothetical protein
MFSIKHENELTTQQPLNHYHSSLCKKIQIAGKYPKSYIKKKTLNSTVKKKRLN